VPQQLNGEIQSIKMDGRSNTSEANTPSATASTLFKLTIKKWTQYTLWLLANTAAYWRKHYDAIHATRSEKGDIKICTNAPLLQSAPASPVSTGSLQLMQRSTNGSNYKNVIS